MPWNRFARRSARADEPSGRTAFLHEDDEGMIDVMPIDNWARTEAFLADAREPPARGTALRTLALPLAEVQGLLAAHLPPFDRVEGGMTQSTSVRRELSAFGPDPWRAVFVRSEGEPAVVDALWLQLHGMRADTVAPMNAALAALAARHPLMLVDLYWDRMLDLRDGAGVEAYLQERVREATIR